MGLFGNHARVGASAAGDYEIKRSLRFRKSGSTYLSRTSSNSDTYTLSMWIKRSMTHRDHNIWWVFFDSHGSNQSGANSGLFFRRYGGIFQVDSHLSGGGTSAQSTQAFRDNAAWFHFVYQNNSNVATCYMNNVLVPFSGTVTGFPLGDGTDATRIGQGDTGSYPFDGYIADVHLVDGSIVAPSSFAETKVSTGQWVPKKYDGAYGTNGFHLTFEDNSGTTATTLGKDSSGNGNNFTPHNFSVAAAPANDSVTDTPTNNYCTFNDESGHTQIEIVDGNLTSKNSVDSWPTAYGTIGASSGKFYYEVKSTDTTRWGAGWSPLSCNLGNTTSFDDGYFAYSQDPLTRYTTGTNTAINGNPAFTSSNLLQVAIDIDAGKLWYGVDNTWVNDDSGNAGNPAAGTNPINTFTAGTRMFPKVINNLGVVTFNFGQQGFAHTPPAGFKELCTKDLAVPTIKKGAKNFDRVIYTGTSSDLSITSLDFQPDLLWIKKRGSGASNHELRDAVRGVSKRLVPNANGSESTPGDQWGPKAFLSNGFTVGAGPSESNNNGDTFVAWNWKESVTAGIDIISYTGNGNSSREISHSLGVAPDFYIIKARSESGHDWNSWHSSLASGEYVKLNSTDGKASDSGGFMHGVPTSSVIKLGTWQAVNKDTVTFIAYLFANVEGFIHTGAYEGNGSTSGNFVWCGFKPAFVMIKNIDNSSYRHWNIIDSKRTPYNQEGEAQVLFADDNQVESYANDNYGQFGSKMAIDILSNGFKVREHNTGAYSQLNLGDDTHIFIAFAERPFKYANAG